MIRLKESGTHIPRANPVIKWAKHPSNNVPDVATQIVLLVCWNKSRQCIWRTFKNVPFIRSWQVAWHGHFSSYHVGTCAARRGGQITYNKIRAVMDTEFMLNLAAQRAFIKLTKERTMPINPLQLPRWINLRLWLQQMLQPAPKKEWQRPSLPWPCSD